MANEKRLIDAMPIIDECEECSAIEWNKSVYTTWAEAEEDFMQRLLDAPIVDAVEVVRCKDCKYWYEYHIGSIDGPGIGDGTCEENPHNWIDHRKAEDFCSYGERKN
jgi:hypothetical protein